MKVRIEHCTVCWGYRDRALALAEALRKRFDADVEVAKGKVGQFDVLVDGKLVSSRGESLLARIKPPRLPNISDVIASIERAEQPSGENESVEGGARVRFSPEDAKRFYDWFGAWQDLQFYERTALQSLVARSDFEHASAVFELGCGTGKLAESLFEKNFPENTTYVGIDISTTMFGIATKRLARWSQRATVRQIDGTARLPYADASFDRFIAAYVLDLLPQSAISHVLMEAHRVLIRDGKLCVVCTTEGTKGVSRIVTATWKRLYARDPRLVGGCRPLRVSTLLDRADWKVEYTNITCSWGICSEIVIASAV